MLERHCSISHQFDHWTRLATTRERSILERRTRGRRRTGLFAFVGATVLAIGLSAAADNDLVDPFEVIAAVDRASEMRLWPGFDATAYPIAIFDGERTLLLRHPKPPEEFAPLEGLSVVFDRAVMESTDDGLVITVLPADAGM